MIERYETTGKGRVDTLNVVVATDSSENVGK